MVTKARTAAVKNAVEAFCKTILPSMSPSLQLHGPFRHEAKGRSRFKNSRQLNSPNRGYCTNPGGSKKISSEGDLGPASSDPSSTSVERPYREALYNASLTRCLSIVSRLL